MTSSQMRVCFKVAVKGDDIWAWNATRTLLLAVTDTQTSVTQFTAALFVGLYREVIDGDFVCTTMSEGEK